MKLVPQEVELTTVGPFSWIADSTEAPPRIFAAPESRECGVYLFTVPTVKGNLIYWAGQTSQAFRSRLQTHSREFLAGTYNILDIPDLLEGKRNVRWKGLWWRKNSPNRYEEYLRCAGEVAPLTLKQLQTTCIYLIPNEKNRRFLARLEAAIVHNLYANPEVGLILDQGYSLSPRWENEEPIQVLLTGPEFRGLPGSFMV